ncbi:hypothetical protein GLYMA_12G151950v4 [Glycine max]|nr:hypothetical protein GLYMA_12G151950v4 [Glycine max]KAH1143302.1 hypothetical protein GYH30_033828 [Glycine max]
MALVLLKDNLLLIFWYQASYVEKNEQGKIFFFLTKLILLTQCTKW